MSSNSSKPKFSDPYSSQNATSQALFLTAKAIHADNGTGCCELWVQDEKFEGEKL